MGTAAGPDILDMLCSNRCSVNGAMLRDWSKHLVFGHQELRYRAGPVLHVDRVDGGGVYPHQALAGLPFGQRPVTKYSSLSSALRMPGDGGSSEAASRRIGTAAGLHDSMHPVSVMQVAR